MGEMRDNAIAKNAIEESGFVIPSWAGKPPKGLHLDVMKGDKLIQKLLIDEKSAYFFGRNASMVDFAVDHASCSRVHAVLVYHKHLKRVFLTDLGSTHGTHIGSVRLEQNKMEQLLSNQPFHFGASTRIYVLRERIRSSMQGNKSLDERDSNVSGALFGLPEKEEELENLTEYNTALNRRMVAIGVDDEFKVTRSTNTHFVTFNDIEDVINPEDVDSSVGRFRNLVYTAVIPKKRAKLERKEGEETVNDVYIVNNDRRNNKNDSKTAPAHGITMTALGSKLGLSLPNPAPEVDLYPPTLPTVRILPKIMAERSNANESNEEDVKKKKYAKEAWPGKKHDKHLLI